MVFSFFLCGFSSVTLLGKNSVNGIITFHSIFSLIYFFCWLQLLLLVGFPTLCVCVRACETEVGRQTNKQRPSLRAEYNIIITNGNAPFCHCCSLALPAGMKNGRPAWYREASSTGASSGMQRPSVVPVRAPPISTQPDPGSSWVDNGWDPQQVVGNIEKV